MASAFFETGVPDLGVLVGGLSCLVDTGVVEDCFKGLATAGNLCFDGLVMAGVLCFDGLVTAGVLYFDGLVTAGVLCFDGLVMAGVLRFDGLVTAGVLCFDGLVTAGVLCFDGLVTAGVLCFDGLVTAGVSCFDGLVTAGVLCFDGLVMTGISFFDGLVMVGFILFCLEGELSVAFSVGTYSDVLFFSGKFLSCLRGESMYVIPLLALLPLGEAAFSAFSTSCDCLVGVAFPPMSAAFFCFSFILGDLLTVWFSCFQTGESVKSLSSLVLDSVGVLEGDFLTGSFSIISLSFFEGGPNWEVLEEG